MECFVILFAALLFVGKFMAQTTPWNKIKAEYLQGVTPKDLAKKYKIKARSISDKAYEENWGDEKTRISENIREKAQDRIESLTNLALDELECVLNDVDAEHRDKISAAKAILDISGLKSSKQEVTNKNGIVIQVADEEHRQMLERIKNANFN